MKNSLPTPIVAAILAAQLFIIPVAAIADDEDDIRKLVREEVERLLNDEGALDALVESSIERFVAKQRAAAERAQEEEEHERLGLMRPVDARRDYIFGDPDAPVTLVEYSDFECPYCKRFHPTVARLVEENPGKLRWVYRHFPLGFHNPGATKQAEAAECAGEVGGNAAFWKFTDTIYLRTRAGGKGFPLANLRPLAEEIGIDGGAFDACMAGGKMAARVREDHENGMAMGITGTPSGVMINRDGEVRRIAGALPIEGLRHMLDALLPGS